MRVIVRRERPHPGAQLSLFEERDGWRYQAFATNTTSGQLAFLEARHRAHARVEDRIRHAKDTGLARFPSREFKINHAWLSAAVIAADLVAWLRLLGLQGDLAKAEPKALRYRLLHVPARLIHSARRRNSDSQRPGPSAATGRSRHLAADRTFSGTLSCTAELLASAAASTVLDLVAQVQHPGRLQCADQVELDVLRGQAVEQQPALTEQDRPELDLDGVEHASLQGFLGGVGAVQHHVAISGRRFGLLHARLDAVGP